MPLTPAERTIRAQIAAEESWVQTEDRSARTANARKAFLEKFENQVDPDCQLSPASLTGVREQFKRRGPSRGGSPDAG